MNPQTTSTNPDELTRLVRRIDGHRVLLVGDLILDRYIYGDAERISPEAPVPVLRVVETREAVGGTANVAACLTALGCRVSCCGTIGADRHGEKLRSLLDELNVDTGGVIAEPNRPTTTKTRLVGLAQHRHRQQLLRVDDEDTSALPEAASNRIIEAAIAAIPGADVVCIEDYDKGVVTAAVVAAIVEAARACGKCVLIDPARLNSFDRYRGADILTPNRAELALAIGRSFDSLEALAVEAEALRKRIGAGAIVTTVDRDGAVLVRQGAPWQHVATTPRTIYDNTGAGDAVLAMLAAATAAGADLLDATRLANVAGGLEVERFGCVPISADEVLAELRLEQRVRNGKLCTCDDLLAELTIRRDRGETVAFTNGCFDFLHAGHVEYLKRARREGSMLIVGLNTDASVRTLDKGPDRPINTFEHRAIVLGALECVDYVIGFDEPDPEALIERIGPDVLIKGEDWAGRGVKGADFVESIGGRVVLMPLVQGLSTSDLIERIRRGTG